MNSEYNIQLFKNGFKDNNKFWQRFDSKRPDFKNKTVLDIGSGWGSMVVSIAQNGAAKVLGVDIVCELIEFANKYVLDKYKNISSKINFVCADITNNTETINEKFDIIISKDAFEHISDINKMLFEISKRLKPGGKLYVGFGPLYYSPYGDHNRRKVILKEKGILGKFLTKLPWGHVLFNNFIINTYNKKNSNNISSMNELNLNLLKYDDFMNAFERSGMKIVYLETNQSNKIESKILTVLSKIPPLRNFCIHNIYCILEKS